MLGVMGQDAFAGLDLGGQRVPGQGTLGVLAVAGDPPDCVENGDVERPGWRGVRLAALGGCC
jgi:hypothetical protein